MDLIDLIEEEFESWFRYGLRPTLHFDKLSTSDRLRTPLNRRMLAPCYPSLPFDRLRTSGKLSTSDRLRTGLVDDKVIVELYDLAR